MFSYFFAGTLQLPINSHLLLDHVLYPINLQFTLFKTCGHSGLLEQVELYQGCMWQS